MARSPQHRARSRRESAASAAVRSLEEKKLSKLVDRVSCAPCAARASPPTFCHIHCSF